MTPDLSEKTTLLLAGMWSRNRPLMMERLAVLDRTAQAAQSGALVPALNDEAIDVAHKLAGSLGMFGFPQGTDLARELECLLGAEQKPDPARIATIVRNLRSTLFPEN